MSGRHTLKSRLFSRPTLASGVGLGGLYGGRGSGVVCSTFHIDGALSVSVTIGRIVRVVLTGNARGLDVAGGGVQRVDFIGVSMLDGQKIGSFVELEQ